MKQLNYVVWVDDTKGPDKRLKDVSDAVIICRNYKQAITALDKIYKEKTLPQVLVCLDYHLGLKKSGTGADVANYIVEHKMPIAAFWIVSIFPNGIDKIQNILGKCYHEEYSLDSVLKNYPVLSDITIEELKIADSGYSPFRTKLKALLSKVSAFFVHLSRIV